VSAQYRTEAGHRIPTVRGASSSAKRCPRALLSLPICCRLGLLSATKQLTNRQTPPCPPLRHPCGAVAMEKAASPSATWSDNIFLSPLGRCCPWRLRRAREVTNGSTMPCVCCLIGCRRCRTRSRARHQAGGEATSDGEWGGRRTGRWSGGGPRRGRRGGLSKGGGTKSEHCCGASVELATLGPHKGGGSHRARQTVTETGYTSVLRAQVSRGGPTPRLPECPGADWADCAVERAGRERCWHIPRGSGVHGSLPSPSSSGRPAQSLSVQHPRCVPYPSTL
jgi:hypothetical protein